jgi:hypothetical protein
VSSAAPLSEAEIKEYAIDWYRKLDVHAPMVELLPLLADADLEMYFPEGVTKGHAGFEAWYQRVIRIFFDEEHTVKEVATQGGGAAQGGDVEVKVVVNWQAKVWSPPEAKSKWLGFDAYQTWIVRRSPTTGKPIIVRYVVDKLDPMPGSATL